MAATAKGLPYPVSGDGRPHMDQALGALAARIEEILAVLTDAQLALLAGADLWDGRLAIQSNTGTIRKWRGLYEYRTALAAWQPLVPLGALAPFTPTITAGGSPTLGTGPTQTGWYAQFGGLIIGRAMIKFGTGATFGTAPWSMSIPVAAATTQLPVIGHAWVLAGIIGTPNTHVGEVELVGSTTVKFVSGSTPGGTVSDYPTVASLNAAVPPQLGYSFRYKAA